jgi:hypothetical protein
MSYKITVLTSDNRNVKAQFNSWVSEPIDTGDLDMDALNEVFGKTENELMRQTIITDDLNTVVAVAKTYHDCAIAAEMI